MLFRESYLGAASSASVPYDGRMGAGDGRTGGLLGALALLARPATFEAMDPTHADVRYGDARRAGIAPLCDMYSRRDRARTRPWSWCTAAVSSLGIGA